MAMFKKLKKIGAEAMGDVVEAIKGEQPNMCPVCEKETVMNNNGVLPVQAGTEEDLLVEMKCLECGHEWKSHFVFKGVYSE